MSGSRGEGLARDRPGDRRREGRRTRPGRRAAGAGAGRADPAWPPRWTRPSTRGARRAGRRLRSRARPRHAGAAVLLIQREAVGLRHHRLVDQQFPGAARGRRPHVIWNPRRRDPAAGRARGAAARARLRETLAWVRRARAVLPRAAGRGDGARASTISARLPFTRKSDLREHYPLGLFAVPPIGDRAHPRLVRDQGQADRRRLHGGRSRDVARGDGARHGRGGARPGELLHIAFGYGLFTGGLGFHQGAERIGMTVVPASSGNTARQWPAAA